MASNKGKKYIKLQGGEVATSENLARASEFLAWYAGAIEDVRRYVRGNDGRLDEDVLSDTMLRVYDSVAYKGYAVRNYLPHFLRAYRNTWVNKQKAPAEVNTAVPETAAPAEVNTAEYEATVSELTDEVLDYVREKYEPWESSLFEIYAGLSPEISYKRLAVMLGIPETKIWPVIGKIKKDVAAKFTGKVNKMLSLLVENH